MKKPCEHTIRPMVAEAERALREAVAHFGLEVKPETLVVTIQSHGKRNAVGWYWAKRWSNGKDTLHEINLSAECLKSHDMGELVLHELAHAENSAQGVKDCTASQRHNKKFKSMAERLGLVVNEKADKRYGYGFMKLGDGAKAFLAKIKFDEKVFDMARNIETPKGNKGSRLRLWECSCGVKVRVAKDDFEATCNLCEKPFELQN